MKTVGPGSKNPGKKSHPVEIVACEKLFGKMEGCQNSNWSCLESNWSRKSQAGPAPAPSAKWGYLPTGEATGLSFRKSGFEPQYPCHFHAGLEQLVTSPPFHGGEYRIVPGSPCHYFKINIRGTPLGAIRMLSNENHGRVWGRCHWDAGSIPVAMVCVSNKSIVSIWEQVNGPIFSQCQCTQVTNGNGFVNHRGNPSCV